MHLDEVPLGSCFARLERGKIQLYYLFTGRPNNTRVPWPSEQEYLVCQKVHPLFDLPVSQENLATFKRSQASKIRVFRIA